MSRNSDSPLSLYTSNDPDVLMRQVPLRRAHIMRDRMLKLFDKHRRLWLSSECIEYRTLHWVMASRCMHVLFKRYRLDVHME